MTIPSLSVQVAGTSQVDSDQFNTYQQVCNIVTDLRGFSGLTGMKVFMGGYTSNGDGGQGNFYWNASGNAPDDSGVTCITPNGVAAGQWTRLTGGSSVSTTATIFPMGRLTLTSGSPVMSADATAQSTIYYAPYVGGLVPIYNGVGFINYSFSQLSLALDSNSGHTGYQQSGKLFDVFAFLSGGVVVIATGPAWSTSTARGTGAGTTQLTMLNGLWTNTVAISLKKDSTATQTSVSIGQATYLGTLYATANGQTGMALKPSPSTGGTNNFLGLYNAYNRVPILATCRDSTVSWTYATATWRSANGSVSNRISFVDGLQQSYVRGDYLVYASNAIAGNSVYTGLNLDSSSSTPNFIAASQSATANNGMEFPVQESFSPVLGLHYIQAMEDSPNATTATFAANGFQSLTVGLSM